MSLQSFAHDLIGLFVFLQLNSDNSSSIIDTNSLLDIQYIGLPTKVS